MTIGHLLVHVGPVGAAQPTNGIALDSLLEAASGLGPGASQRSRYIEVTALLNRHFGASWPVSARTVEKWFERNSITGTWLIRLVAAGAAEGRAVDLPTCIR